jgi:hypothetical protein
MSWFDRSITAEDDSHVAGYMSRLAAVPPPHTRVPDPDLLWVKAQIVRRWEMERKAQTALDVMEPIQIAAGLVAAGVLLVWSLPSLLRVF